MVTKQRHWTNASVLALAGCEDPMTAVVRRARSVVLDAMEEGWKGPPYDPFDLAHRLGVTVMASEELEDARTVPEGRGVRIEYNPNRPWGRLRFSLAHEIAHTFFPDCARFIRNRADRRDVVGDEWQLELLCNVAAAEILMPIGTFSDLETAELEIDELLAQRKKYDVSTEALFLRVARLTRQPATFFAASRTDGNSVENPFRIEYAIDSSTWTSGVVPGDRLPKGTVLAGCTAVGYTAKGEERWGGKPLEIQCVGTPPYPGQRLPRVLGFAQRPGDCAAGPCRELRFLYGDATDPRNGGHHLIIHVVNDKTPNWGGPFARALRKRWPLAQIEFRDWARAAPGRLTLGETHTVRVDENTTIATMIAQRGYGSVRRLRLSYAALSRCLDTVAEFALARGDVCVHMPRIGAGEAGGNWSVIQEMIENALIQRGIDATVYTLSGADFSDRNQRELPLDFSQ